MRIGIALDKLYSGKIGGAEQYIRNTINIWNERNVATVLFLNKESEDTFEEQNHSRKCILPERIINSEKLWNYYIHKWNIDVLFCPLFYIPVDDCGVPMVTTIHDIQYEYYPQYFQMELLRYRKRETQRTLNCSERILTVSEYTKRSICEKYGIDGKKIYVTYEDADASFQNGRKRNDFTDGEKYILYPANGWEHKNHKRLIDALEILQDKYHSDLHLMLTGNAVTEDNRLDEYIEKKGLSNCVSILGYVDQKDMPGIFQNARMLVFPSLFEGFGIPLVEAMRSGIPIACSRSGSIPEICADAGLYFDPYDAEDMAEKIFQLDTDDRLRMDLIERGKRRKKDFSWKKCADQTYEVLLKAAANHGNAKDQEKFELPKVVLYGCQADIKEQAYPKIGLNEEVAGNRDIILFVDQRHFFRNRESIDKLVEMFVQQEDDSILFIKPEVEGVWGEILEHRHFSAENENAFLMEMVSFCAVMCRGMMQAFADVDMSHTKEIGLPQLEIYKKYKDKAVIFDGRNEIKSISLTNQIYIRDKEEILQQVINRAIFFDGICSDGWMSRYASLPIDLRKGQNEIVIGVGSTALQRDFYLFR